MALDYHFLQIGITHLESHWLAVLTLHILVDRSHCGELSPLAAQPASVDYGTVRRFPMSERSLGCWRLARFGWTSI